MRAHTRLLVTGVFATSMGAGSSALAQNVQTDAYWTDNRAQVAKNAFGQCWRTQWWTPAKAIAECDPDLVAKPAPKPPVPAPVAQPLPTPPVVPVPAPAPIARVIDSDRDGVPDDRDACPSTVAGATVDARGCELDRDRDGVVDRLDRCPDTRASAKVDASGCELAEVKKPEVLALKGVNFATSAATLRPGSTAVLDDAATALLRRGDVKVEVAGHTDNRGSAVGNRALSQQRADAVMRYLVSKGVNPGNVTARGYGPDQPIAENGTEPGRAANRRVELRILQ